MKLTLSCVAIFFWCLCPAALPQQAQMGSAHSNTSWNPVAVRGQVYAPDGAQLERSIALQFQSISSLRPSESFFTDTAGRFALPDVVPWVEYSITIEAEANHWRRTIHRFRITTDRAPVIQVYLEPPEVPRAPSGSTVSASALRSSTPRAARKEFDAALKHLRGGEPTEALGHLERAIMRFPGYSEAHNEIAVQLIKSGNLGQAEEHLQLALKANPDALSPNLNLGLCLQCQGRFADAQPVLEKTVRLYPDHPGGNLLLGLNCLMIDDEGRAEPLLIRAYELGDASVARAQYLLAQFYARHNDFARAAKALETYMHDVPQDPDTPHLREILGQLRRGAAAGYP